MPFGSKTINLPVYTDKVNKILPFEKEDFASWDQIKAEGFTKETITTDDDFVIIKKEFIAFDESFTKTETIRMTAYRYSLMKYEVLSPEEAYKEIKNLEGWIIAYDSDKASDEYIAIQGKIEFLKNFLTH